MTNKIQKKHTNMNINLNVTNVIMKNKNGEIIKEDKNANKTN